MSKAKHQRAALIAALLASYNVSAELLRGLYNLAASKRLRICHQHFIEAAQYMGAQMMLGGYNFYHHEGSAFGKAAAVVAADDIPTSLLDHLNGFVGGGVLEIPHQELRRWASQLRLSFVSDSFFWKWFMWCKPAIEKVYFQHQQKVLDVVRRKYAEREGLHIAADGAFDSRGYSALIGKVVMVDLETSLILHTEVLHRSETNGSSSQMEVEGLRRLLRWLSSDGWSISSITTDRNRSFATLLDEMKDEIGSVQHFWDGWHLVKWFGNNLRKESKHKGCIPLSVWYEKLKTHLWNAIEVGEGERIRHIFNTCLKHVQDVHAWRKDELTGKITRCGHPPLEGPRPETITEGTPAFDRLRQLVLNKNLQKDLAKASPRGGTSICESKNALDRLYCRKEIFYPLFTYKLYTMLSTMHFNTLRFAEMAGERRVQRVVDVQRKYFRRTTRMVFKTPVEHLWRDQIAQVVLDARREQHDLPPEDVDLQRMIDAEAAFEEAEPENVFEDTDSDDEEYEEEL
ncbi:hypothetical protein Y032_0037g3365 [Ancylostoma ceylanicum]|nr:hypothetical protein Y032_0037g3365 [Ancylostoma ceylanicum]